jgi:hypothetical protein
LCNPNEDDEDEQFFTNLFTINGAPVEWNRQGKTDNSEKILSQCHFVHDKSHMDLTWDRTPGLRGERPATNRLNHGTAVEPGWHCRYSVVVLKFWISVEPLWLNVNFCGSLLSKSDLSGSTNEIKLF